MSVTLALPALSNLNVRQWLLAVIVVVIVVVVPPALVNPTLGNVITLSALLMGASVPVEKYSNRRNR